MRANRRNTGVQPRALAWLAAVELGPESTRTLRRLERLYREVHTDAHAADAELNSGPLPSHRRGPDGDDRSGRGGGDPARGNRRHHPVSSRVRTGLLCGTGAARRAECEPAVSRPDYAEWLALVTLGARRSGDACGETPGRHGALGAPARGAHRRDEGPRRARPVSCVTRSIAAWPRPA